MNNEFKDYYRILGVTPDASIENIRRAYDREMSQNWSNPIGRLQVQEAYQVLTAPDRRRQYDEEFERMISEREMALRSATTSYDYADAISSYSDVATTEEPVAEQQATEEPVVEQQATEEPVVEQQATEEPVVEQPTIEEPVVEQPSAEEPVVEQPTTEEPVAEQPATEDEVVVYPEQEVSERKSEEAVRETSIDNTEDEMISPEVANYYKIKKENIKKIIKRTLISGGAFIIGGIPGIIVANVILNKKGKLKLQKNSKHHIIKDIKTSETRMMTESSENLQEQIDELLEKSAHSKQDNVELEVAKLKYQNQIELLQKRIEFKQQQSVGLGTKTYGKLELLALKMRLKASSKWLEMRQLISQKTLDRLDSMDPTKKDKLAKIEDQIVEHDKKDVSKSGDIARHMHAVKGLKLSNKRMDLAQKISTKPGFYANKQAIKSLFVRKNKVQQEVVETPEEEIVRTR